MITILHDLAASAHCLKQFDADSYFGWGSAKDLRVEEAKSSD